MVPPTRIFDQKTVRREPHGGPMTFNRRSVLVGGAALSAGLALEACKDEAPKKKEGLTDKPKGEDLGPAPKEENLSGAGVSRPVLEVLAAVSERILPADGDGPGAKDANVATFFEVTLADERLRHLLPLLKRGAGFLARASQAKFKQARFAALADDKKDELLRGLAEKKLRPKGFDGATFVRIMVALTLEGYLCDPKHGGNADRVAWKWLRHNPAGRRVEWGGA
jgi:hypothetical protein